MSDDLATLRIKIESLEAAVATKRLTGLERQGGKTERATDSLTRSSAKLVGGLALVAASVRAVTSGLESFSTLEALDDQLVTATGSLEAASLQFDALNRLSAATPFQLEEVIGSFIKLKNLGLDPSEEALLSYGNTAAAMGKSLDQLIEAVADAAVGEFERLKEFGIKSSVEGDKVQFRFKNMTTTVKNSSEDIQKFLLDIGQNEFAGGMELQADNLDTAFSNLGAATDLLTAKLADDSGLAEATKTATAAITDFFNSIVGVPRSVAFLEEEISRLTDAMDKGGRGRNKGGGITLRIKELREELRAAREISTDAGDIEKVIAQLDAEIAGFEATIEKFDGVSPRATLKRSSRQRGGSRVNPEAAEFNAATKGLEAAIARREALQERIDALSGDDSGDSGDERGKTATASIERRIAALELEENQLGKTRRQVELLKLENKGATPEELALADAALESIEAFEQRSEALKEALDIEEEQREAFRNLEQHLRTEEETISESYDRRLAIILQNTEEGSLKQEELRRRLNEEFATSALGDLNAPDTFEEEIIALEDFYQRRRELILSNTELTEKERTDLEVELTEQRNQKLLDLEAKRASKTLSATSGLFDNLAGLAEAYAGEQSGIYKGLFAVSKAFAVAESIVNIQAAIAKAAASGPPPANFAAMAAVVSATAGLVSNIQGATFTGAYDRGGHIPAGGFGIVGEFGPEFVRGPADVTSRKETMDMVRRGGDQKITIINNGQPVRVVSDTKISDEERQIIIADAAEAAEDRIASGIVRGDSNTSQALESTFSLDRAAGSRR